MQPSPRLARSSCRHYTRTCGHLHSAAGHWPPSPIWPELSGSSKAASLRGSSRRRNSSPGPRPGRSPSGTGHRLCCRGGRLKWPRGSWHTSPSAGCDDNSPLQFMQQRKLCALYYLNSALFNNQVCLNRNSSL